MIIGVLSDTHHDRANAIPHIIKEFKKRKVEVIFHCGDIESKHLNPDLFGNLPVVCALIEEQKDREEFCFPPNGWRFTVPGDRIVTLPNGLRFYIGHKRAFEFLKGAEAELTKTLEEIRKDYDCVQWLFSGHTHHQIFKQDLLINFLNPGAVESSFDGYEFAVIDTDTHQTTFSRIPTTKPVMRPFSIGIISDSLNISELDVNFWAQLAGQLRKKRIKHIIHCGNISVKDIGRKELSSFTVHYFLREDQINPSSVPDNWQLIPRQEPTVIIGGYRFHIQLELGVTILDKSEMDMHRLSLETRGKHPETNFILFGSTNYAFLEEGEQARIINPGDVVRGRNYAIIKLPTTEITFSSILPPPLS
ncbi:MAG: metallophosphoesterase family protein [Sedimentisphaerales bacterium]|nr:metallophosphoesterase family protein [Sedimentisphaerales bacterium]